MGETTIQSVIISVAIVEYCLFDFSFSTPFQQSSNGTTYSHTIVKKSGLFGYLIFELYDNGAVCKTDDYVDDGVGCRVQIRINLKGIALAGRYLQGAFRPRVRRLDSNLVCFRETFMQGASRHTYAVNYPEIIEISKSNRLGSGSGKRHKLGDVHLLA